MGSSGSNKEVALRLKAVAETAIGAIGLGYDVTEDLRLKYCKGKSPGARLIGIDDEQDTDVYIPGGILIQNVSKSISCDKGERMRFSSDILSFQQMSEQFNQEVSLSGRIPTGQFNAAFEFTGSWQKDAANTKALAMDGVFITLYDVTLKKSQIALSDHVKNALPTSWEPAALAKFIKNFGTHVIVGVKIGGKDTVYMKQQYSSTLTADDVQRKLKDVAEKRFSGHHNDNPRKARDLELVVDVGNNPVTGLRLYLEGKRNDCLAIHLQHLSSIPKSFKLMLEPSTNLAPNFHDRRYLEKVQWKSFSHICTAPVESDDELSIVTGAEFEVSNSGEKRVLFLRLRFAKVVGATVVRKPEWDGSPVLSQKSGIVSALISTRFSNAQKPPPQPKDIMVNSALPVGPPISAQGKKLLKFVDTTELVRGPQDLPGYWTVSGARLMVDKSKISLRAKFSLLAVISGNEETYSG